MEDMEIDVDGPVPEQLPVRPHLRCRDDRDLGREMGAPAAINDAVRLCRNALILSVDEAMIVGCAEIHYSRNGNTYSLRRSWLPEYWTFRNVVGRAIADLTLPLAILIEHRAPPQSPRSLGFKPKQSTLSAGPDFRFDIAQAAERDEAARLPSGMPATIKSSGDTATDIPFQPEPGARIRLRDGHKQEKPIPDAEPIVGVTTVFQSRYDLAIGQARIEVRHPDIDWVSPTVGYAPARRGKIRIDLGRRHLVRIFSRDMRSGGRWYHAFWEEIGSTYRKALWIDGAPVFEHDFSACHLRLAYYAANAADALAAFGDGDLYVLPGFDSSWRTAIKRGIVIMLNANSLDQARRALARKLDPSIIERRLDIADEILAAIKVAHPALERFWHSGCGIALQFVDSEIMRISIERLLDRGVLALPLHDSLLVAAHHKDVLIEVMEHTFATDGQRLARERFAGGVGRRRKTKQAGLGVHDLTNGQCGARIVKAAAASAPGPSAGELLAPWQQLIGEPAAVLSDFTTLVTAQQGWSKAIIRAALHMLATGPGGRSAVRASFQAWQASVSAPSPAPGVVSVETRSFFAGTRRRPTAAAIARRCKIDEAEAARLNLVVLRPLPSGSRREAMAKRARRMAQGVVPLIMPVNNVKPWLDIGESRSGWYARTTDAERQVLALQSIVRRGDNTEIDRAAESIAEAKQVRRLAGAAHLPVDDLLAQLEAVLMRAQRTREASQRLEVMFSSVTSFNVELIEVASSVVLEGAATTPGG